MPVQLHSDVLFDVLKFCDRFDINERLEFIDAYWAKYIAAWEHKHFALYKMDKLCICSLFCSLHYSMTPYAETTVAEIFMDCSEKCAANFLPYLSDDWPAQRVPFCIYIQRSFDDDTSLKKITMNNGSWKIERPECAHFFYHFKQLCFRSVSIDLSNDKAVTWFLLDCPILREGSRGATLLFLWDPAQTCPDNPTVDNSTADNSTIPTEHFALRTTTDPLPFQRVTQLAQQKVALKKRNKMPKFEIEKMLDNVEHPVIKFVLGGRQFCSVITIEAHQFPLLFELIEEYKSASTLQYTIPTVRLFVPTFPWHRRPFIEHTFCEMFHTSEKLGPLVHRFGYFDEISTFEKFNCLVRYQINEEDKIECYELRVGEI